MSYDRRAFLKRGGLAMVAIAAGSVGAPPFLERAAWAGASPAGGHGRRKTLVAIFLRGAMDGLAAAPPLGGPELSRWRPSLALGGGRGERGWLGLDAPVGLHPAFEPWLPLWREGHLTLVHGVGSPHPTRSHFDAQEYMEAGTPGRKSGSSGWLNRVAGRLGHEPSPFRAVALTSRLPRSLAGPQPAVAVADLADLAAARGPAGLAMDDQLLGLWGEASEPGLRDAGGEAAEAVRWLREAATGGYRSAPGAAYPPSPLGRSLRQIAFLVKAEVGLEVGFAESGGWDTHVGQGGATGTFARRADDLARSVAAFWTDLGRRREDVVVLTMTEFGRTVRENGSGGTDHGHASCLFVMGTEVAGRRVHGEVPSLAEDDLHEGRDLPVTTDFRSVFAAVAGGHLGVADGGDLFPGWAGRPLGGLFRG